MTLELATRTLALAGAGAPFVALLVLAVPSFLNRSLAEAVTGVFIRGAFTLSFLCFVAVSARLLATHDPHLVVSLGRWIEVGSYTLEPTLVFDLLSLPFGLFAMALCGVTASFSHRYLHREPGYNRFFIQLALFGAGTNLVVLAGGTDTAFAGWEMLGLSSALLVGFFHDRPLPVRNGLRVFVVYRVGDVAFLCAAVLIHHDLGSGSFETLAGGARWPDSVAVLSPTIAEAVGLLLVLAAMAKSAQVPFSGWLPRAMEGPTPSSAIFYGAISIHAGTYLLLRTGSLLENTTLAPAALILVGVCTALLATLVGRVQTDIKSALAYASLTQVGIIFVEIGLGLKWLPLVHMLGHASARSLQFLRAPSLLHDFHAVENAVGGHLARTGLHYERLLPQALRHWLYRLALARGHLDDCLDVFIVRPFLAFFTGLDGLERAWCRWLAGGATHKQEDARPHDTSHA